MPVSTRTPDDDQISAEQWMVRQNALNTNMSVDVYRARRMRRDAYATGLADGRQDGLTRPHFTKVELERALDLIEQHDGISPNIEPLTTLLQVFFPHATFETSEDPVP